MKLCILRKRSLRIVVFAVALSLALPAACHIAPANPPATDNAPQDDLCAACLRKNLEYLAGPKLRGRGSGTTDEYHAAEFIASKLEEYGLLPAANGRYIQRATALSRKAKSSVAPARIVHTWNVLAKIEGGSAKDEIVLLSAHLDHLGVKQGRIYPGADDDASGTVAVMELARVLAKQPPPSRTIVFALWGSEEVGMIGACYFLQHPTVELKHIVANLEFEMVARPDPQLRDDQLWMTGWERSNLGPELVAHGADLVADPRPSEDFFARSDNYVLAKEGIVAQTVSSFGLHKDYHRPTDTLQKVDWEHLDSIIGSMIGPVLWLVNSDFIPRWNEGKKP